MTRLQTMVYETEQLLVADPREMTSGEHDQIKTAFTALLDAEHGEETDRKSKEDARDDLDRAVLSVLGLENRLDELKLAVQSMVEARDKGSGQHTQVLIDQPDEKEIIELAGVSNAHESATLSDYE